jgi:hypothetical protein
MENRKTPLAFSDQVIRKFVDNLLGADMIVLPEDYQVIRTAFRSSQGKWEEIEQGNLAHLRMLTDILKAWGSMPQRKREAGF